MRLTPLAKSFIAAVVVAVVAITGWHYQKPSQARVLAVPEPLSGLRLRLTGSGTIGASLAPKLVRAWLERQGATQIAVDDLGTERVTLHAVLNSSPLTVEIASPGTAVAFECLRDGECDIGMASRPIKDEERRALSSQGDFAGVGAEHILALDGIAVIVNRSNRVAQLKLVDVAHLFTGEVRDWAGVGGEPGLVHVYSRDVKSGTFDAFSDLALHGAPVRADARVFDDATALANAVASEELAVGFSALSFTGAAKPVALCEGQGPPFYPTVFTVATEDYPLTRRLRLYAAPSPAALVRSFLQFAVADEGQRVVEEAGFVSLRLRRERPPVPAGAPARYRAETRGADRLSLAFRFRKGQAQLDTRGVQDLDRLVAFLARPDERSRHLMLFGFADKSGSEATNLQLSQRRAQMIADHLTARGVKPDLVVGLGSVMPVAPNDSDEGRERNRRVEVWVR